MKGYHYVYTLQSISFPDKHYTGQTQALHERLAEHNDRKVPYTSKFAPWIIRTATAFRNKERAIAFERYLKSGSGKAFLQRHL
ncbi:MAG: excinuclease subunit protein [Pedosphaera sp.]|nr:excinuclease subunit protein [Pedosphaera sp.]